MAEPAAPTSMTSPGLSVEVFVVGLLFTVSAGLAAISTTSEQNPPAALLFLGWPVLAAAGAIILDRVPAARVGRALAALSLTPVLIAGWTVLRFHSKLPAQDLARSAGELSALLFVIPALALPWAFRSPRHRAAPPASVLALTGAGLVVTAKIRDDTALWLAGWAFSLAAVAVVWATVMLAVRAETRLERRRITWVLVSVAAGLALVSTSWAFGPEDAVYYATCAAVAIGAVSVAMLWRATDLRPLDEHLLDAGLVAALLCAAVATAVLVRLGSELTNRPMTTATTVFTAVITAVMAAPGAWWTRRAVLNRRYGSGLLPPEDVARITADLHARAEPRDLLGKAARMVAAASGSPDASIVLDEELPAVPDQWQLYPLVVGNDRVGALLVQATHPEGPETRQRHIIEQLLPTVALVARAVGLAVEAEHARRDVSRERDEERKRVMGDLHDGLGPSLAGMSMRVQAMIRTRPEHADALREVAKGLATARADLRRIVAGITPSVLADGNLELALAGLVDSFDGAANGTRVKLETSLTRAVAPEAQVAVYRSVAEGITNALRHARPSTIRVCVRTDQDQVVVEVADDGAGGPIVPGVGLSSLARRAESLGGRLTVSSGHSGTVLHIELPVEVP